jgi:thiamine monophosphate synthase
LRSAGAARIAVSGAICGEERPGEAARDLLAALRD